ncbi:hypothetical protein K4H28_01790 [Deefgea tanakiae]|uniref:Tetratricopeptide repeat protein n=1 Tax=Deefgea tanakiae TaxID=2865840 RepID=A0ABX8Z787_9NEIS|nr:hypothetical protein [Deefgea tanakiae]QZA78182.1 hypothetical protein K4H28_01790 [Deefgea tanakiae]
MGWLASLFGKKEKPQEEEFSTAYVMRQGKSVEADEVFLAWSSGDLERMLKATELKANLVDRHFLLQTIVALAYKQRKDDRFMQICLKYADFHLREFPDLAIPLAGEVALAGEVKGYLPRVTTFQYFATALTEVGQFEKAIEVCELALSYGLHDGTESGFEGRMARIKKKALQKKT